ncbi:MAG: hypothetical protein ACLPYO_13865 [Mycobacterium sp.]
MSRRSVVDSLGIDTYLIQVGAVGPFMGSSRFPEAETQAIARLPGVESAIPVVYGNTILQDPRSPQNVNVYGVPEQGLRRSRVWRAVVGGVRVARRQPDEALG